jgi:hypothetical protein
LIYPFYNKPPKSRDEVIAKTASRAILGPGLDPSHDGKAVYTFKSRGELLAACLLLDTTEQHGGDARALAGAMSVEIDALEPEVDPLWVMRDTRTLVSCSLGALRPYQVRRRRQRRVRRLLRPQLAERRRKTGFGLAKRAGGVPRLQ